MLLGGDSQDGLRTEIMWTDLWFVEELSLDQGNVVRVTEVGEERWRGMESAWELQQHSVTGLTFTSKCYLPELVIDKKCKHRERERELGYLLDVLLILGMSVIIVSAHVIVMRVAKASGN